MNKKRNKKHNFAAKRPKIHKLTMTWEVQDKDRRVQLWRLMNGKGDHDLIPMSMFLDIHKGDLGIALRKHLIPDKQTFHIHAKIHARNDVKGETVDVDYDLKIHERMTLWQFMEGYDESYPDEVIYVNQGHGLRTRWEGLNDALETYLEGVGDDDYKLITNHCTITCYSAFNSFEDEAELQKIKMYHLQKLGVGT